MEEVGKILPAVLRTYMRREGAPLLEVIAPLWSRIAGREIAGQSQPTAFEAGRLTLSTSCPSWALQLRRMAEELRAEINSFFRCPVVKKVEVKLTSAFPQRLPSPEEMWLPQEPEVGLRSHSARASAQPKAAMSAASEKGHGWR